MVKDFTGEYGIECLLDGARGIYIPQAFIECYGDWKGITKENKAILETGPDHEHYWETWDEVLLDAYFINDNGKWTLHQDGDLFIIHEDFDFDNWQGG